MVVGRLLWNLPPVYWAEAAKRSRSALLGLPPKAGCRFMKSDVSSTNPIGMPNSA